jgi:AcrR family transcriptional regulator
MPKTTNTPKSEETRNRILESALELFRQRGFENTTMRDIAKAAGVALGAAYYYYDSKDALVMGFYERAQTDLAPLLESAQKEAKGLEPRLCAVINTKFEYFSDNRKLMGALSAHIDPEHPLSPFSKQTQTIREFDIQFFSIALEGSKVRIPEDLNHYLPRLLWLYQMGLMLFWVYDSSPGQSRTRLILNKTLAIVARLIKISSLPLLRPIRKVLTDLLDVVYADESTLARKA